MVSALSQKRGGAESDREGLGLGLYIASEIARAHGVCLLPERRDSIQLVAHG